MTPKRELWYNRLSANEKKARKAYAKVQEHIKRIKSLYRRGHISRDEMREMMRLAKYTARLCRKEFSVKAIRKPIVKWLMHCPSCGYDVAQCDDLFFPRRCVACGQKLLRR